MKNNAGKIGWLSLIWGWGMFIWCAFMYHHVPCTVVKVEVHCYLGKVSYVISRCWTCCFLVSTHFACPCVLECSQILHEFLLCNVMELGIQHVYEQHYYSQYYWWFHYLSLVKSVVLSYEPADVEQISGLSPRAVAGSCLWRNGRGNSRCHHYSTRCCKDKNHAGKGAQICSNWKFFSPCYQERIIKRAREESIECSYTQSWMYLPVYLFGDACIYTTVTYLEMVVK